MAGAGTTTIIADTMAGVDITAMAGAVTVGTVGAVMAITDGVRATMAGVTTTIMGIAMAATTASSEKAPAGSSAGASLLGFSSQSVE
ncbi:hypothetical protein MBUL_00331 [Methylobacterium bullatum]|uniref:Uncharacterized protein n=1 Tax=Methylobacterium bullatum TaxID=570505 RepID=A0A679IIP6_9HYPH|nr:hypothetical protein MBUL_00331 [Methylobacterium bullatum]